LATDKIVNIGTGREYVMADVAATILRLTGAKITLIRDTTSQPGQVEHLYCSVRKAKELLSWQPTINVKKACGERSIHFG
jgi:nucleoside-diphosphate-sugar epimerase